MKNILRGLVVAVLVLAFSGCKPSYITKQSEQTTLTAPNKVYIIKNYTSVKLPHMIRPSYKQLENLHNYYLIKWSVPAYHEMDKLIYSSLNAEKYDVAIVENENEVDEGMYIMYKDYWTWDLKRYLHLLEIKVFEKGNAEPIAIAVLEGSKSEFHSFPNPKKEIPILINRLFH